MTDAEAGDARSDANPCGRQDRGRGEGSRCCRGWRTLAVRICSSAGVCLLLMTYTMLGAVVFSTVEGGDRAAQLLESRQLQLSARQLADSRRLATVERLWHITITLNVLHKDNWTRLTSQELASFQRQLVDMSSSSSSSSASSSLDASSQTERWSFYGALLYSTTVITTIGYGATSPSTDLGKLLTIAYAVVGIPLVLVFLSNMGDLLARCVRLVFLGCCSCRRRRHTAADHRSKFTLLGSTMGAEPGQNMEDAKSAAVRLADRSPAVWPFLLCALFLAGYIVAGGFLLQMFNSDWSALDGAFFCFVSLSTIGFGELRPASSAVSQLTTAAYLLLGMALVAMCFSLLQEHVVGAVRSAVLLADSGPARPQNTAPS